MNIYISFITAFKSLGNNKKRSFMTMLGIIIGISSVITILSIGRGFERETLKNLREDSTNNLELKLDFVSNAVSINENNVNYFNHTDISMIEAISGVKKVTYATEDSNYLYIDLTGTSSKVINLVEAEGFDVEKGRPLSSLDNNTSNNVVTIDFSTAEELYSDAGDALNKGLDIQGHLFFIVGIYKKKDENSLMSVPDIQIPQKSYNYYFNNRKNPSTLNVILNEGVNVEQEINTIIETLTSKGSMSNFGEYEIFDKKNFTEGMGTILTSITYFISAIASISLFIAGIGIMNMMYTIVSERAKEIGIRRALGASKKDIVTQFLLEGIILTFSGGVLGYIFGIIGAYIVGLVININVYIDLFTVIVAISISSAIGVIFSIIPAWEASKRNLSEIIR